MGLHIGGREMAGVVRDTGTATVKVLGRAMRDDVAKKPGADVGAGGEVSGERNVVDFVDDEVGVNF